ncbi:oxidoreductase [Verminephrobacter aporrectodeae subsp. tuberculatae]|uniref:2-hydroxyacid dehydrogenase n=2 Tax=Verminephrobacter aporrectodeae TaxID=1110389 RepID=UPI002237FF97|nr:2-hydroxyacid dehydrogenase [Verminephrobacter aporrectodeae]MCW5222225.1 oxidoreductase [Verminephrobacter aporrectodeae subsp. tuberculatae]MCW5257576.1 oxidoreductase [Verminephrobacter aporrectodeae subsp. tuberculatae]MCW5287689.1 oxidoreductase [Verminephrobacter aporrectodeae subsp. tuberculatae]MCW8199806.1 oxidoreductase [Verminephrobacter aporrectodeae subsp. tuberculatae]MCW8207328.1 oxidoreductase [Verminephrobacter aporrectodeae subsp. tuberculatae]
MRHLKLAIIGDQFMKAHYFSDALRAVLPQAQLDVRTLELDWPDTPTVHGYGAEAEDPQLQGLREYLGAPHTLATFIGDAEVLLNHLAPVTCGMLARCAQLRLLAVARGGPVNIDMQAARTHGLRVVYTPGRNASAVAEFTIGMVLAQTRRITQGHVALMHGQWRGDLYRADRTGEELCNQTLGLIGYGHIGSRVTKLLRPFGCRILVSDPYAQLDATDRAAGVLQVDLAELLAQSDVVSLHARVTPETTGFMNAQAFAQMKEGACFINTARGPLVDYAALYAALQSGRLRGAALETFGTEPCDPADPLLRHPHVTLTPHIAGASIKTVKYAASLCAEEVRRYLQGEAPAHPC